MSYLDAKISLVPEHQINLIGPSDRHPNTQAMKPQSYIKLFRERLLEKVHGIIPKGIVGGFVCPVLQRNLKEWHERPRTYVRKC